MDFTTVLPFSERSGTACRPIAQVPNPPLENRNASISALLAYGFVPSRGGFCNGSPLCIWAFPAHSCGSGYIARQPVRTCGTPASLLQQSLAPKNIKQGPPASLCPKGSLSLTRILNMANSPYLKLLKSVTLKRGRKRPLLAFFTDQLLEYRLKYAN